jgi:hypothetical protein
MLLNPLRAAEEAQEKNFQKPAGIKVALASSSLHPTLKEGTTQYGVTCDESEHEFDELMHIVSRPNTKVLDIGAAYGSPVVTHILW